MNRNTRPAHSGLRTLINSIVAVIATLAIGHADADDWGAYTLVPASAQSMVLEAVASGTEEGTIVSINKPAGTINQKWWIVPKGENIFAIQPLHSPALVL